MFLAGILSLWMLLGGVPRAHASRTPAIPEPSTPAAASESAAVTDGLQQGSAHPSAPPEAAPSADSKQAPPPSKPAKKKQKKATTKPATSDPGEAPKKVVKQGSTAEPTMQVSPTVTDEESTKLKASTSSLRNEAQTNLDRAAIAGLKPEQQETVAQIKKFLDQSKDAEKEGDLPRASSLATKAKVLSESLQPQP